VKTTGVTLECPHGLEFTVSLERVLRGLTLDDVQEYLPQPEKLSHPCEVCHELRPENTMMRVSDGMIWVCGPDPIDRGACIYRKTVRALAEEGLCNNPDLS